MQQYKQLVETVMAKEDLSPNRTETKTKRVFAPQLRFNLQDGFPLLTGKKVPLKSLFSELVMFIEGSSNAERLHELGGTIWDEWAITEDVYVVNPLSYDEKLIRLGKKLGCSQVGVLQAIKAHAVWLGESEDHALDELMKEHRLPLEDKQLIAEKGSIGPMYGTQWRAWKGVDGMGNIVTVDQLKELVDKLRTNPFSRRLVVNVWNTTLLPDETVDPVENVSNGLMALAPCHPLFQCFVENNAEGRKVLSLQFYMRSTDIGLGLPFNIASYAALTHLFAREIGADVGELVVTMGDSHIYSNHFEGLTKYLERDLKALPSFELPKEGSIWTTTVDELVSAVKGYDPHPAIPLPVAR